MRNLLLYCVFFLVFFPLLAISGVLNDDVLGLIVLKADLQDPTSKLLSWNEDDDDPCGWIGVKCNPRTNRVTELNLDGFSLSGKIGRGLLQLQSLRKLSLSRNNFSGSLNPNLSQLESLWSADLSENNLSGSIPDVFFRQCRSLRSISLANNDFSGEIPPSVGSCSTLAVLNFSSNQLSGRLPSGLWSLYGLRSLDLSGNSLSGDIPMGISRLYNLRAISLHGNRLSGRLPDDIGGCLLLKSLDLRGNLLTGSLPETLQNLSMCSYLSMGSNSFSGDVPVWIGEMRSLETLDLSSNWFSGQIPDSIGQLQLVKRLDFSHNGLTGSLPESIGTCKSLLEVDFSQNSLTGNLPTWIFESGLQVISISGNKMSGFIQIPIATDETLKALDLSSNGFSGGIPVDIRNMHGLQFLNLSWNSLSGSIPASIGELKSMQVLDLSGNRLNGSIPPEIGGAVSLNELRLQKNSLTGGIPSQIANCSSLTSLILSQNNLTGSIPPTLANLTNLQTIDLSRNRLTGTLPKQFSNLPHLISFNISHNLFSGDLPAGNFFDTIPNSSVSDNPGLCGSIVNRSCPAVLPKPIVLNPNSSSPDHSSDSAFSPGSLRHKKIILSISTLIAIGAAAVIALGVITITVLNIRVRSSAASQSAAPLALSDDYYSHSPGTEANSGKLVMFSGNDPDFSAGAHAILNKDCELGRGGFGTVYKTILRDGRPMAIKKLTVSSLVKSQEDFEREVKKLGKVRHPNLVTLEGYYWTPSLQLLIYEFVSGGNLYRHLHESSGSNLLSWQERFDIILGIARSLAHLHRFNIIHYNLKSSNILIDGSGEAKVGDYGLAKLLPMLDRYVLSSKIQSALGYMAPEFACRTVKINEKCDVYGFGVLVLEIMTGRRPVEYMEDDVVVLCDVVKGALEEGRVEECVDGKLGGKFPVEEAVPVVKLGLICTSQVPSNRPDMAEVVNILQLIRCPQDSSEEELS
ncbi:probable LRR receptor-like serine/threonine-protein kinase IRK [Phoenix dactylifera]|uniref:Probable LRR receptor-like serine/threonine-protein kinase IRK n=1 Tax=Phoenix dactylifera TaxID=42345 RepID=A0A8B7C5R5_PHODC|nr:probable LRR receptor-like serine/threonine-protein kinase IRK [Phoenix dactylifera]